MSLLTIVQDVADEVGVLQPSTVIGSSDESAIRMLVLANKGGKILARRGKGSGGWAVLQTEHTFTTVNGTANYSLPSDYDFMIDGTIWDRTTFLRFRGPLSPREWQLRKSGLSSSVGSRFRFRILPSSNAKVFAIEPTPTSADSMVVEYVSLNWCQSSGGTGQAAWVADTDTGVLDEVLLNMDLTWRFKQALGEEYGENKQEFEMELAQALARDGGAHTLSMSGHHRERFIGHANLPDSGFG